MFNPKKFLIYLLSAALILPVSTFINRPSLALASTTDDFFVSSGVDKTQSTHNFTSTDLNKLSSSDNDRYQSDGFWPKETSDFDESEYIEFVFNPELSPDLSILSVELSHEYQNSSALLGAAKYEVWNGSGWLTLGAQIPGSVGNDIVDEVDLFAAGINTVSEINSLKVRYLTYVTTNNNVRTKHDLVKLEVVSTEPPEAPDLLSPVNEAIINDSTPTFDWTDSEDPDGEIDEYKLVVSQNPDLSNPAISQTINPASEFTPENPLEDGQYFWRVTAFDDDGASASSEIFSFNLDSNNIASEITFPQDGAFYSSQIWQPISGTASDSNSGVAKVEVQIQRHSDNLFWNTTGGWQTAEAWNESLGTTEWTYDLGVGNLTDGESYTVKSRATDNAGNQEATDTATFTFDDSAPVNPSVIINNNDTYTTSRSVNLILSANDPNLDKVSFSETCVPGSFSGEQAFASNLPYTITSPDNGNKTLCVRFTDKAGNEAVASDSIILDTSAPAQSTVESSPDGQTLKEGTGFTLEGTAEPGSTINVYIFSDPLVRKAFADDITGKWSLTITDFLLAGDHFIEIEVVDKAGNKSPRVKIATFSVEAPLSLIPEPTPEPTPTPVTLVRQIIPVEVEEVAAEETPTEEVKPAPKKEEVVAAQGEGEIKAEEAKVRDSTRILVTIAILIIAAGVGIGGWYGYQWWMAAQPVKRERPTKKIDTPFEPPREDRDKKTRW